MSSSVQQQVIAKLQADIQRVENEKRRILAKDQTPANSAALDKLRDTQDYFRRELDQYRKRISTSGGAKKTVKKTPQAPAAKKSNKTAKAKKH